MQVLATHKKVIVSELPKCDFKDSPVHTSGAVNETAHYDAQLPAASYMWANLCPYHFKLFKCELGLGKGQELILGKGDR